MAVAQRGSRATRTNAKIAAPGAAAGAAFLHRKLAPRGLTAAIDAGWLVRQPSTITRLALARIDYEVLWLALHLDTDDASAFVKAMRSRCKQLGDDARALRKRVALLDRVVGPELDMVIASLAGHHRGNELARKRWIRRNANVLADLEDARDHLAATATTAEINHGKYHAAVARAEHRASPRYSGGWRAFVLAWLRRALGGWTLRDLAKLLVASTTDFRREHRPPCSAFVDGASVEQLADRIKHLLARHT